MICTAKPTKRSRSRVELAAAFLFCKYMASVYIYICICISMQNRIVWCCCFLFFVLSIRRTVRTWQCELGSECLNLISELQDIFIVLQTLEKVPLLFSMSLLHSESDLSSPQKENSYHLEIRFNASS